MLDLLLMILALGNWHYHIHWRPCILSHDCRDFGICCQQPKTNLHDYSQPDRMTLVYIPLLISGMLKNHYCLMHFDRYRCSCNSFGRTLSLILTMLKNHYCLMHFGRYCRSWNSFCRILLLILTLMKNHYCLMHLNRYRSSCNPFGRGYKILHDGVEYQAMVHQLHFSRLHCLPCKIW